MEDSYEAQVAAIEREYVDFLDTQDVYQDRIFNMIENNERRFVININDLRRHNPARALALLSESFMDLHACQNAVKRIIQNKNPEYAKKYDTFFVGVEGSFGSRHATPRTLKSSLLGNMVCLEGIITKCSMVRPKVVKSVHYCPVTGKTMERRYADLTSISAFPATAYPTKDGEGNILETEYGLCEYKDHQSWTVQEMPEKAPAGQLPRSVDAIADDDLVDKVKPGDRVQLVGQYRCLPGKQGGFTTGTFRTILIVNHVQQLTKQNGVQFEDEDIPRLRQISRLPNIVELLTRSIAPSIHGHEYVKQAVLMLLLGGVERHLDNGSRIRGDINLLLLGDPSVAKSQFLRFVLHCAPRAIATTGRGSSGVGLTAAVTTDPESGERHLEAGAMVLADRGIVCIDEFDKMTDIDRTAIHEVMEQGRVTIAKAGIQAKLNARCSVLAAANPVYGRYNQYKTPMENIGMQDSLLSRFDLLFILLDKADPETDAAVADHVLRVHRYRAPGEPDGTAMPLHNTDLLLSTGLDNENNTEAGTTGTSQRAKAKKKDEDIFETLDDLYGSTKPTNTRSRKQEKKYFTLSFLQKYIQTAHNLKPILSAEAADLVAHKYCDLRSQENSAPGGNMQRTQPITARTLETLIRLATAHAKARWSLTVTREDAAAAADLISYAIFKEVLEKNKKKRQRGEESDNSSAENSEGSDDSNNEDDDNDAKKSKSKKQQPPRKKRNEIEVVDLDEMPEAGEAVEEQPEEEVPSGVASEIQLLISRAFQEQPEAIKLSIDEIVSFVCRQRPTTDAAQVKLVLNKMHEDCRIMVTTTDVFML